MPPRSSKGKPPARRRRWRRLLAVYLVLLAASHALRHGRREETPPPLPADMAAVELAGGVRLAYAEWGERDRPAVVLLHGSPGSSGDFYGLGPLLGERFRVIAPDLPGFGRSTRQVPDYSIRAHAGYVLGMLDALGVQRFHLVGFSMGGGVALEVAGRAPERVRSVVLLSSIGLQSFELLGQYQLNHAIHGLQLIGLWLVYEAVPHFGGLDDGMLDLAYARNFYDSDQRPLRRLLTTLTAPVLIVHGEHDPLVSVDAAREHHRLVPQSELVVFPDGDHFMVFTRPGDLAPPLRDFLERVEAGEARSRAEATPERLAAAAETQRVLPKIHGFALVVWMALVAAATFISEDLACLAAGLLVARGRVDFVPAVVACAVGIFVGDLLVYLMGRLGRPWLERAPLRWLVRPADVERSRRWFRRRGGWVILASRFLPGTRLPTYLTAGLLRVNALWFTVQLLVPVAVWTPILVGLSRYFGERVFASFDLFERYAVPGFAALLAAVWSLLALVRALATHDGRRRLLGWWRRKTRWEFWPPWVFYPPLVVYVLLLGLRRRAPTLFTAANPGLPAAGGFLGESKSEILAGLDPRYVARWRRIPDGGDRRAAVRAFQEETGIDYPLVLKPDLGQRGTGVRIVRRDADVEAFLAGRRGAAIVQEYVPGPELGIFYVRRPGDERGRIFSITEKILPSVVGDGRRTLARLVLDDPRAVALWRVYLAALGERAERVPAAGEEVRLVDVGTHCRGAVFRDGSHLATPALADAVDRVSRSYDGFYFGRFDFRAPSLAAFREGRDLKVLELNGVTSEATHIYDPKHRLRDAYRILFEQWRLAFAVGAANRERGTRPASVGELVRMLLALRRSRG